MKARWLFEVPHTPIEDPMALAYKLKDFSKKAPDAWPITDLLGNVQHLGGWKGAMMRQSGVSFAFTIMDEPEMLHLIYLCDSRVFEGECGKLIWALALKRPSLKTETIEDLFQYVEQPDELSGAPFGWFVANHSNWPRELLLRHGVNPDCKAPPRAPFAEKLLAYKIPAAHRERFMESIPRAPDRFFGMAVRGAKLAHELPMMSILATFAQEVMREGVPLESNDFFKWGGVPPEKKFSPAAIKRFREPLLIGTIVDIWVLALPFFEPRPLNRALLADFEKCIFEEIPELLQEERFFWFLDAAAKELGLLEVNDNFSVSERAEMVRSLKRLRGGNFREKPFATRMRFTGAMPQPAAGVKD